MEADKTAGGVEVLDPIAVVNGVMLASLVAVVGVGNIGAMLPLLVDGAIEVVIPVEDVLITEVIEAAIGGGAHSAFGFFLRRTLRAV